MADTIQELAEDAVSEVLQDGQATTQDGVSVTSGNLKDAYNISRMEDSRTAQASGARPLLRGFNLSSMGYE